ncbi:MAG: hypothetical protein R2932_11580 [Caldilineaceae bacterium]
MKRAQTLTRRQALQQWLHPLAISTLGTWQKERKSRQTKQATFVLIHGAWHGGWWKSSPHYCGRGHEVFVPTLTGR